MSHPNERKHQQDFVARLRKSGGRSVNLLMKPELAEKFNKLAVLHGQNATATMRAAIEAYFKQVNGE